MGIFGNFLFAGAVAPFVGPALPFIGGAALLKRALAQPRPQPAPQPAPQATQAGPTYNITIINNGRPSDIGLGEAGPGPQASPAGTQASVAGSPGLAPRPAYAGGPREPEPRALDPRLAGGVVRSADEPLAGGPIAGPEGPAGAPSGAGGLGDIFSQLLGALTGLIKSLTGLVGVVSRMVPSLGGGLAGRA